MLFIPDIINDNLSIIDDIIEVSSPEAKHMAQHLNEEYLLGVGMSSGANFYAAKKLAGTHRIVVSIFPDSVDRYKSLGL